jgi:DNA-binding transcriptional ArsR family regulator
VAQRDGGRVWKLAPLRKNLSSLRVLRRLMHAANERYLAFIATLDNPDAGLKAIDKMAKPARHKDRSYRGFNLFLTLARGEWAISGFRAADLRAHIADLSPARASYWLKRLRTHGLIKKIGHRYKYYLTKLGRRIVATALSIRESTVIPTLNSETA